MMDPLSIIVSVGALSKATWSVSKFLVLFIQSSSNISQPCKDLVTQVEAMANSLSNLQSVLDDPTIVDAETFAAERRENEWETSKLWVSVHRSVLSCREVLSRLQKTITGFTSDPSRIPQKMWLQIRLNMKEGEMRSLKEQISFHLKVLQSSVQTLSLRAIYLIPGRVNADIVPRIAGVEEMIKELRNLLQSDKKAKITDGNPNLAQSGMETAKDTIESALEVMSSARTAYAQSESSGSVIGEPLDPSKAARIELWVPEPIPEHPLQAQYRSPSYSSSHSNNTRPKISTTQAGRTQFFQDMDDGPEPQLPRVIGPRRIETFTSTGETIANSRIDDMESSTDAHSDVLSGDSHGNGFGHAHAPPSRKAASNEGGANSTTDTFPSDDEDTGADSDLECEVHEAEYFFEKGSKLLEKGQYKEAMECYRGGMEPASKLGFKLKQKIRFDEHKLLLATCLYQMGDLIGAEQLLYELSKASLAKPGRSSDDEGLQLCQACFLLALIYLRKAEEHKAPIEANDGGLLPVQPKSQSYLTAANKYCRQAMKGRWRIQGRESVSYFESIYLLSLIERASGNLTRADGHYDMIPTDKRDQVVNNLSRLLGKSAKWRPQPATLQEPKPKRVDSIPQHHATSLATSQRPFAPTYSSPSTSPVTSPQSSTSASPFNKIFDFPKPTLGPRGISDDKFQFNVSKSQEDQAPLVPSAYQQIRSSHKGSATTTTTSMFEIDGFDLLVLRGFMGFLPQIQGQPGSPTTRDTLPPPELLVSWLHRFDPKIKPFVGPMHVAAAIGHTEAVNMFLAEGDDATQPTSNDHPSTIPKIHHCRGATPLHFAATYDQVDVAKILLRGNTIRLLEVQDKEKKTALHYAARAGAYNVLMLLLERKADVAARDVSGNTPAIFAAMYGHLECLELLYNHGASVHVATNEKCTCLHFAAASGHTACVEFLLSKNVPTDTKSGYGQTPLVRAAETGNVDVVRLLIENGVDLNSQDHRARTPLHGAATFGKTDIARLLIESGAKTSYCDIRGKSALALAKFNKYEDMIELLQNPPKPSKEDKKKMKNEKKQKKDTESKCKDKDTESKCKDQDKESKCKDKDKEMVPSKEPEETTARKGGLFSFRKKSKPDRSEPVAGGMPNIAAPGMASYA